MVGRTGVPRLVGWLFRLEWACPTPAGLPECAVTGEGACTVYRGLRAHTCSTPSRPWWVAIHVHRGRLSLARVGRTPAPTITYTITRTRAIHPDTKPRLVNGRARTRNRETEAACRRFAAPRASFRQILGYVHTGRALPSLPPSLHQLSIRPPTPSRPTPSDPDRLKWFVFDLTTTAAAVHGGTLFPPRTLPSFSVSRRMCGGVAPLPARYVCIYIFVCRSSWHARSVYDAITSKIFRRVFGRLWLFGGWNGRTEETGGDATVRGSGVAVLPPPPPLLTRRTDIVYPTI